ncbi:hypothetical protein V9T40_008411 [Parthenolecanium corni]|uniref:Uncharacterized protein n=1 Tax=Parthenolecanium corni TaxID=536013 RepID=A0AAN9TQJ5_9HEMI
MIMKRCISGPYPTSRNMDLDTKMENLSSSPTTNPPDETTRSIIVYGYPETEEPKVPPPPDLTNTGPVGGE